MNEKGKCREKRTTLIRRENTVCFWKAIQREVALKTHVVPVWKISKCTDSADKIFYTGKVYAHE